MATKILSAKARLLLLQMIVHADEQRRLRGDPRELAQELCPDDNDAEANMRGWLHQLEAAGHIERGTAGRQAFIAIVGS